MARRNTSITGREKTFGDQEVIVSKTDLRGILTYVNDVFIRVSAYSEAQLLGAPHNIIRHPGMPRCIFKLLWDTIQARQEIFAYVLNLSREGDGYWVFAHVTPSFDLDGNHIGYHSNRRTPYPDALRQIRSIYRDLLAEEARFRHPREGMAAGTAALEALLAKEGQDYAQFVFGLSEHTRLESRHS